MFHIWSGHAGLLRGCALGVFLAFSQPAFAKPAARIAVSLPRQSLADSLRNLAVVSGRSVLVDTALVANKAAPPLRGNYTMEETLNALLAGSGLKFERVADGFIIVAVGNPAADRAVEDADIVVTGTRLRGAPVASTVIRITRSEIINAGQENLGEVARDLPQSFGGGQNPGVGFNVPASGGVNIGSGSSFNLRGLGSDATLTLLNGRRLPYSSSSNSIDISAIPLVAVDRVEIVPDGASALYGSDAVAGVVNIILRDRFSGFETSARIGGSTDGGNFQQQYSGIAGTVWQSGRGFIAYEYEDDSAIRGSQRSYAAARSGLTLMPPLRSHRVVGSVHQSLFENLTFSADGLYNHRASGLLYALNPAGDLSISRTQQTFAVESFNLSPAFLLTLGPWQISLAGTYGRDVTNYRGDTFSGSTVSSTAQGRYTNRSRSLELSANGDLFSLPAGPVRVATGAGLRVNDFTLFRGVGVISNIDAQQNSRFVYGEIGIPIVASAMGIPFIERLELNAAARYENYRGIGGITTPKLGLIFAPSPDLDFKLSWGRSFRAPTFIQQYQVRQAALYPAGIFTGTSFPAGATALVLFGGNRDLGPEKATSWSATLALHPRGLEGFNLDVSYFSTRYIDRIVNPVPFLALALSSPLNTDQVTLAPAAGTQSAIIASADQFFNFSGSGYDPSRVVAIINTANVNAGRQTIQGIDVLMRYNVHLGGSEKLTFTLNLSYLDSVQQLTLQQPTQPLSGRLFSPPHWRGRGSIAWKHGGLTTAVSLASVGGVSDPRTTPATAIRGMTAVDLSARYAFDTERGPLHGFEIGVTAQNTFNTSPANIATTLATDTPYDSTNYSPAGRVLSVRLTKKW